jgi:hypothetical protein
MALMMTGRPSMVPEALTMASLMPVLSCVLRRRSE